MSGEYKIILAMRVAIDLEEIAETIAKHSEANAAKVVDRILLALEGLKQFPHRNIAGGFPGNGAHPVRSLPVRPYVIYFRVFDEMKAVHVVRVVHGARRRPRGM